MLAAHARLQRTSDYGGGSEPKNNRCLLRCFSTGLRPSCSPAINGGPGLNDPQWPAKNIVSGSGVAPQTHTPLHTIRQKRCFWIPGMGVFELYNAKKYCLGSGVALQTLIPLYPIGRQRWFWLPRMGVFAVRNAEKLGFWRGASSPHTSAPNLPERLFLDT